MMSLYFSYREFGESAPARVTVFPQQASSRTDPDYRPEGGTLVYVEINISIE